MTDQAKLPLRERRPKSYLDDDGKPRCMKCDGYLKDEPGAKCTKCANARKKKREAKKAAERHAESEAKKEAQSREIVTWRRNAMKRHIARLLATQSGSVERQQFIEDNPIAGIFR